LIFEDCFVPDENLLGKEGGGFIDACACSMADASRSPPSRSEWRKAHTAGTEVFERARAIWQAIRNSRRSSGSWPTLATENRAAKASDYRAAAMKDAGMKTTLESSMAKLYASEVAVKCAQ